MKTFRIIVLLLVLGINATAQENQNFAKILDTYVGTWVYQKNDTVFKIKFQKGQQAMDKKNRKWTLWRILSISQWKSIGRLYGRTSYVLGCIKRVSA